MFKDKKTTYVAIAAGAGFLASVILVAIGKATLVEAGAYLGAYTAFLVSILGMVSKDSKTTTSKNKEKMVRTINEIIIETEQSRYIVIPGRGIKEPPPKEGEKVNNITLTVTLNSGEKQTLSVG